MPRKRKLKPNVVKPYSKRTATWFNSGESFNLADLNTVPIDKHEFANAWMKTLTDSQQDQKMKKQPKIEDAKTAAARSILKDSKNQLEGQRNDALSKFTEDQDYRAIHLAEALHLQIQIENLQQILTALDNE